MWLWNPKNALREINLFDRRRFLSNQSWTLQNLFRSVCVVVVLCCAANGFCWFFFSFPSFFLLLFFNSYLLLTFIRFVHVIDCACFVTIFLCGKSKLFGSKNDSHKNFLVMRETVNYSFYEFLHLFHLLLSIAYQHTLWYIYIRLEKK